MKIEGNISSTPGERLDRIKIAITDLLIHGLIWVYGGDGIALEIKKLKLAPIAPPPPPPPPTPISLCPARWRVYFQYSSRLPGCLCTDAAATVSLAPPCPAQLHLLWILGFAGFHTRFFGGMGKMMHEEPHLQGSPPQF